MTSAVAVGGGRVAIRARRLALVAPAGVLFGLMLFWPLYSILLRSLNQRHAQTFEIFLR